MTVDWHAHVYPPELAKERRWGGTTPLTIENLLEAHERAGIDLCVVSNTIHYLRDKSAAESLKFLRRWNEYGAEIQQKYKDKIVVFSSTLPCGDKPFLKELEQAIVDYGLKGVLINSSHQGAYPDDDEARPFFELVTVAYHPPAVMCAYQTVGAKQLLFGSDAPPLLPLLPRAKRIVKELPIPQSEREDIFGRNALRLLKAEGRTMVG
jgi:predicted TIM-barrel fold metal-dependent hydrolase